MHLRHARCTCTAASRGFGPRTTPICSKAYARPDGRADAASRNFVFFRNWATRRTGKTLQQRLSAIAALCEWGCLSGWLHPAADDVNIRWLRELAEVMRPFTT